MENKTAAPRAETAGRRAWKWCVDRSRRFTSIRVRLFLILLAAMLPLTALLVYSAAKEREAALAGARANLRGFALSAAKDLETRVMGARDLLTSLIEVPAVRNAAEPACSSLLAGIVKQARRYNNVVVARADGEWLCGAVPAAGPVNYAGREWFPRVLASRAATVGKPVVGLTTRQALLPVACPILGADGRVDKVVAAGLDLNWIAGRFARGDFLPGMVVLIWDEEGHVLFRNPDTEKLTGMLAAGAVLGEAALRAQDGDIVASSSLDGVARVYAVAKFQTLAGAALSLAFGAPTAEITGTADRGMRRDLVLLALLATGLFMLVSWILDTAVRQPVARLAEASARFGAGDLTARAPGPHPGGEIGFLMTRFNETAAALEAQTEILRHTNRTLRTLSECNQALVRATSESQLLEDICDRVVRFGGYRFAWVGYAENDAEKSVRPFARSGFEEGFLQGLRITWADEERGRGPTGTAIRTGEPCVVADLAGDQRFAPWREAALARGYASCVALPLVVEGRAIGALNIYAAEPGAFLDDEIPLLKELADDLAYGIAALRSRSEHERAEQEIRDLNASLERRVAERTQQLDEASRAKSDFLASMSHELRTPLNSIIGFSEMLKDGVLGELQAKQRGFAADIFGAGTHLLSLINDILDLSKVEAGMLHLEPGALDVAALLTTSTLVVREKAAAHRIKLDTQLDAALGSMLADERKLKQIIYNLLSNAVKFTSDGGAVTLRARRCARAEVALDEAWPGRLIALPPGEEGEFLAITVEDTGVGIAEEHLPKLFEPFVQVDSSVARRQGGTGLGLSLVRRLAELHGGTVGVASRPEAGSRFCVWLPYRAAPLALVIEDDDRMAELIAAQLHAEGFQVMRAATAEEGLVRAAKRKPQLITLDIFLPAMDGWEFMRRLKGDLWLADTPVVIISLSHELDHGLALGARRVLQKPFVHEELVAALAGLVDARPNGESTRVLLVDENVKSLELLAAALEAEGCRVLRAYGGAEAIEAARSAPPDLVILDLMMPEVSGFEVARALRGSEHTARIPILVLAAQHQSAEDRARLNDGVSAILAKTSFSTNDLLAELRRAISRWPAG